LHASAGEFLNPRPRLKPYIRKNTFRRIDEITIESSTFTNQSYPVLVPEAAASRLTNPPSRCWYRQRDVRHPQTQSAPVMMAMIHDAKTGTATPSMITGHALMARIS
jgi:hypothetical protein